MENPIFSVKNDKQAVGKYVPQKKRRGLNRVIKESITPHLLLAIVGLLFLLPFAWLVLTSLKTLDEIFAIPPVWLPETFLWSNYSDAIKAIPFFRYIWNTVVVCLFSVAGQLISAPLVAYAFARMKFKGRDFIFFLMMATMILPYQVTMIPLYVMYNKLGMVDTYLPLTLPNFFGAAFYIFLLRQFFLGIPHEYSESAKIDGASEFRIYWQIILPLSKPVLFTVALLTFLGAWGDFLGPLIYLNDPKNWTLSVGLKAFIGEHSVDWGMLMAASTMFTIPIIILYFFVQRQFIQGITLTGFK
ncbi:carbohydrate ABC transporter permease [Bacillus sp. FJAT-49711]|uniref:carbohydrate ABC transporter permease n=1 Tax=Bacillus sp. FJAT-49711 TaxID=2833585 RepID=UPI001BC99D01|nr:carbohydrate ABC transporter permease [Bacillus sp. FJAT-49711]MBS4219018.1 carbohydrate ABC transporter permease [Bacillus sp. FJAT-49711]